MKNWQSSWWPIKRRTQIKLNIDIWHADTHDGMARFGGFQDKIDPLGGFTVTLDELKEALEEAGYDLLQPGHTL